MGKYNSVVSTFYKPLKFKKIGRCMEWSLRRRGKKDFSKGIVKQTNSGIYLSPFFKKEISICISQINVQKEKLEKVLLLSKVESATCDKMISKNENRINSVDIPSIEAITKSKVDLSDYKLLEGFIDNIPVTERINRETSILVRISNKKGNIEDIKTKKEQTLLCAETAIEITRKRCAQIYNYMLARLSSYWSGVLISSSEKTNLPPIFDIETLLDELKNEIETICIGV